MPSSGGASPLGVQIHPPDSICSLLGWGQNELDTDAATPARLSPVDRTSSDMDTDDTPPAGPPVKRAPPSSATPTPAQRSLSGPHPRCPYLPFPGPQLRPGMSIDRVIAAAEGSLDPSQDPLELSQTRIQAILRTTSFGGILLRDVLNVARLGDPLLVPQPSPPQPLRPRSPPLATSPVGVPGPHYDPPGVARPSATSLLPAAALWSAGRGHYPASTAQDPYLSAK